MLFSVEHYIKMAEPITSFLLQNEFNVSSATLRNELNSLEAMGYLEQIHTSGGRIPTSKAYKFYVENILESGKLNVDTLERVRGEIENKSVGLISTLSALARRLNKYTSCPTILISRHLEDLEIEKVQIIPLMQKDALLLIETKAGVVDENINLSYGIDASSCLDASTFITERFKGKTIGYLIDNIADVTLKAGVKIAEFKNLIDEVTKSLSKVIETKLKVTNENTAKLLKNRTANEYKDTENILSFIENDDEVLLEFADNNEVEVKIGEENSSEKLKGGMVITAPIVIGGVSIGSLSLVGPKRVDYKNLATALKLIVSEVEKLGDDNEK